jgi:quinol-cytochrome oxidoreductase complex cytochrome b subunit
MAMLMVYLHFSGVRRVGMTEIAGEHKRKGRTAFRRHMLNLGIALAFLFGVIGTLAVLFPHPFGTPADTYATPTGIGPPWYLLAPFGFLEWASGPLPRFLSGGLLLILFIVFVAWPFIDRGDSANQKTINWLVAALVLAAWIIFSLYGARVA